MAGILSLGGVGAGAFAYDAAVLDWQSRGGVASGSTLSAMDTFFRGLRSDAIFSKVRRLNLMVGATLSTGALIPQIVGTGASTDTGVNLVSGDYTEAVGITGNGTSKYLDVGSTLASLLGGSVASGGMGFYLRASLDTSSTRIPMGSTDGSNAYQFRQNTTPNGTATWGGTVQGTSVAGAFAVGGHHLVRASSTLLTRYVNGVPGTPYTTGTTPITNGQNLFVFGINNSGVANSRVTGPIGGYWVTDSMSDSEVLAFYNRLQAFQTALGRNV